MTIFIPTPLQQFTGGLKTVEVDAATVTDALRRLTEAHAELRKQLFTEDGKLRAFVNLYLNDEDVRYLPAKEATTVTSTDTLSIIPSIAGGSHGISGPVRISICSGGGSSPFGDSIEIRKMS